MIEYLSTAAERVGWARDGLPSADLCVENAIILRPGGAARRYPLMVDPAGQAAAFVMRSLASRRITRASFVRPTFLKSVETALRFGVPLLVDEAEHLDPVLNGVLNRESRRAGGRVLVTLGDAEVDVSPHFLLFLATRDATATFSPDLCSRVTLVNFSVTAGGLEAQCVEALLEAERPDAHARRADVRKLQGEYRASLYSVEEKLLHELSSLKGNILDDDGVLSTLEHAQAEAAAIAAKAEGAEEAMAEVAAVAAAYTPLARLASAVYFVIAELASLHPLYRHDLHSYLDLFARILDDDHPHTDAADAAADDGGGGGGGGGEGGTERLALLEQRLFSMVLSRVSPGLLEEHRLPFALALARARLAAAGDASPLEELLAAPPSDELPVLARELADAALRGAPSPPPPDLGSLVAEKGASAFPLLLCGAAGHDASSAVDALAAGRRYASVALGSAAAAAAAERALRDAAASGGWVLLKNAHLVPQWLPRLEKLLRALVRPAEAADADGGADDAGAGPVVDAAHVDFRVFLTMELSESLGRHVPAGLLALCRTVVAEPPPGLRAAVTAALDAAGARVERAPAERARLHLVLAATHATLLERLRFVPDGWSKVYAFGAADLACARMSCWTNASIAPPPAAPTCRRRRCRGRRFPSCCANVRTVGASTTPSIVASSPRCSRDTSVPKCSRLGATLRDGLALPEGATAAAMREWAAALPDAPPSAAALGLPAAAEALRQRALASGMLRDAARLFGGATEGEEKVVDATAAAAARARRGGARTNCGGG